MARFRQQNPSPTRASAKSVKLLGSGVALGTIARNCGSFNPEISEAFTVAPEVVYSPIVPAPNSVTNKFEPSTAISPAPPRPEISAAFTVAPEVVYTPIVLRPWLPTNRFEPDTAMPVGSYNPVIREAFTVAPEVVYSPTLPAPNSVTNKFEPDIQGSDRN